MKELFKLKDRTVYEVKYYSDTKHIHTGYCSTCFDVDIIDLKYLILVTEKGEEQVADGESYSSLEILSEFDLMRIFTSDYFLNNCERFTHDEFPALLFIAYMKFALSDVEVITHDITEFSERGAIEKALDEIQAILDKLQLIGYFTYDSEYKLTDEDKYESTLDYEGIEDIDDLTMLMYSTINKIDKDLFSYIYR